MGLFDTVRCRMPLPVEWPEQDFQTKQLGCQMDTYTIAPSGSMIKHGYDYGLASGGYRTGASNVPIDGMFEFYDAHPDRGILTLRAVFVVGHCRRIEMVSWEPYPNSTGQVPPKPRASDLPAVVSPSL